MTTTPTPTGYEYRKDGGGHAIVSTSAKVCCDPGCPGDAQHEHDPGCRQITPADAPAVWAAPTASELRGMLPAALRALVPLSAE